jgi:hypothetical protein
MSDRFTRRIYLAVAAGRDLSADDARHLAGCDTCQAAAARAQAFDAALRGELAGIRAPMPADPLAVHEGSSGSRSLAPGLLAGVLVLLAGGVGAGILWSPDSEPSPTGSSAASPSAPSLMPSPSASPRPTPSDSPSATPSPTTAPTAEEALQAGDYAVVSQSELALYDEPNGTSFASAQPGSDLYVIGVDDGWAEVQAQQQRSPEYIFGWVQVEQLNRRAPTACLDVEPGAHVWFGNVTHPQRDLECNGSSGQVVARGYAIDRSGDVPGPYDGDPSWLAGQGTLELVSAIGPAVTAIWSFLHLPPELEGTIPTSDREGFEGTLLEVTGHFDDPRSSGCRLTPGADGYPPVSAANAELLCRQRFVVDAVRIVEPED